MTNLTEKEMMILGAARAEVEVTSTDKNGVKWGQVYLDNIERFGLTERGFAGVLGSLTVKGFYKDCGECFGEIPLD